MKNNKMLLQLRKIFWRRMLRSLYIEKMIIVVVNSLILMLLSDKDSGDGIDPKSHKEKLEEIVDDDDDEKDDDKHDDAKDDKDDDDDQFLIRTQRIGSLEIRTKKMQTHIPSPPISFRTALSLDMEVAKELTGILEKINDALKEIIPKLATSVTNDLIKDNLLTLVKNSIKKERKSS
ncbi:hypothetical protein Tco_0715427 [Tanacetum coccineum]